AEILQLEGRLKPERAVHVAAQVCRALGTAHESSITHRDLKPENIVLIFHDGDLDFVKVVDFGICKHTDDGANTTSPGLIIGAPDYMAPEQAAGAEANEGSDIYALGCVLFEMLTGRVPYRGRNAIDVLMKKGAQDAPRVSESVGDVPETLSDVVAWCLARRPEDRPESMRALELDLMRSIDPDASQSIRARRVLGETSGRTPAAGINAAIVEA
ncbi:MAG: serine/threonine protein kinase, partial [Gemmatimonadetes bacterium]|nr:serine/threonine protein kinase [Gemmatimonadota bacterium]